MARFNTPNKNTTATTNRAGGPAFTQSPELELVSAVITSFAQDTYYEKAEDRFERIKQLLNVVDPLFAAKLGVYARVDLGMRSISHVLAAELAPKISGKPWAKDFFYKIIHRPDDMTEIISYLLSRGNKIPNALKKGFSKAFHWMNDYSLSKYKGDGKTVKLVDVINLVHPVPSESNKEALTALINGTLAPADTWETQISAAGQPGSDKTKAQAWADLLTNNKLGYFALLRNLRNLLESCPNLQPQIIEQLTNRDKIKKSLVLPFRFFTAITELEKLPDSRNIISALSKAAEISLDNVPKLPGKTLIAVDVSGSMQGRPSQIATMFGAVLYKATDSAMVVFEQEAKFVSPNPDDSLLSIMKGIPFTGGDTNFHSIFALVERAQQKYDRIIILSDMQSWMYRPSMFSHNVSVPDSFAQYKAAFNIEPKLYSFDLQGYGDMQFPEKNVFCLAGFSDKIFDIMGLLEQDPLALINKIKSLNLED